MMKFRLDDPETTDRLFAAAREAKARAYAPYSKFPVGAAILTDKGVICAGCNVENASYPLTQCAERIAIGRVIVEDAGKPIACAVVGETDQPLTPCGACRQILAEFNLDMTILCEGRGGVRASHSLRDLLPHSFRFDASGEGE